MVNNKKKKKTIPEGMKEVYLDYYDSIDKSVLIPIGKIGDPITENYTIRFMSYKGEKRWVLVRKIQFNADGQVFSKIERKVAYNRKYSPLVKGGREKVLEKYRERSEHARIMDKLYHSKKDFEGKPKRYSKSMVKNLNRIDLGSKFHDKPAYGNIDVRFKKELKRYPHLKLNMKLAQRDYISVLIKGRKKGKTRLLDTIKLLKLPKNYLLVGEVKEVVDGWYEPDIATKIILKRISLNPKNIGGKKLPLYYVVWQLSNGYIYIIPRKNND